MKYPLTPAGIEPATLQALEGSILRRVVSLYSGTQQTHDNLLIYFVVCKIKQNWCIGVLEYFFGFSAILRNLQAITLPLASYSLSGFDKIL